MDDHGPGQSQPPQGAGHRIEQVGAGHPQNLGLGGEGIDQGTEQIEDGADAEAAAQRRQLHQGRVPAGGEQKGDAMGLQCRQHPFLGRRQIQAQGFQNIGRTDTAAGAAVAVFGYPRPAGGGREGHRRGDVEGVGPVAAGAAGIHQFEAIDKLWKWAGQAAGPPQHGGHGRQFFPCGALGAEGGQQGAGEDRIDGPLKPALHQGASLDIAQGMARQQLLKQLGPGLVGSHHGKKGRSSIKSQEKARVQGTPGRVMGTPPLSPEGAASGERWADRNGQAVAGPSGQANRGKES